MVSDLQVAVDFGLKSGMMLEVRYIFFIEGRRNKRVFLRFYL